MEKTAGAGPPVSDERFYDIVDVLDRIAQQTGKSVAQLALNWVMHRPTVASVIMGARTEEQLLQNLGALGWRMTDEQLDQLEQVSKPSMPYPYWHQQAVASERNPLLSHFFIAQQRQGNERR